MSQNDQVHFENLAVNAARFSKSVWRFLWMDFTKVISSISRISIGNPHSFCHKKSIQQELVMKVMKIWKGPRKMSVTELDFSNIAFLKPR